MQIKFLAGECMTKSRIPRRLGVTRQTVCNHLARTEATPEAGLEAGRLQGVCPVATGAVRSPGNGAAARGAEAGLPG
jgi:hypothetical protein